jgi:hypothetical protein
MTYAFEFNFPKMEEGSEEAKEQLKKLKGVGCHFQKMCGRWLTIGGVDV